MSRVRFVAVCLVAASILFSLPANAQSTEGAKYTPEQIQSTSAAVFLERMQTPEPGYHRFSAMWALTDKVKGSTPGARSSIMTMVISAMRDASRAENQRFQCCYVISGSGYEAGIPDLIQILLYDPSEIMRSVAAEALGKMGVPAARDAMMQAARTETSKRVRDTLTKYLGKDMPALEPIVPTADQCKAADDLLQQLWQAWPGKPKFDAIDAIVRKLSESSPADSRAIASLFVAAMNSSRLSIDKRWPCCYVIARTGQDEWVPDLTRVLLNDPSETMRAVAAESLGGLPGNAMAREAMMQAATVETSQRVRQVLAKYLGDAMPSLVTT